MRTWLDEHTEAVGRLVQTGLTSDARAEGMHRLTDCQIMRELTLDGVIETIEAAKRGKRPDDNSEFLSVMAPFFATPEELRITPYACVAGRDLGRLFAEATASPEIVRHANSFAKEKQLIYIDVADRAFRLGEKHHLRAIFIVRVSREGRYLGRHATDTYVPDDVYGLRMFSVVGGIGEERFARAHWHVGGEVVRGDDAFAAIARRLSDECGVDIDDVVADIENLVWLTLAYAAVAEPGAREPLPMASNQACRRLNRAERRQRRHFTLFRVERLRPPSDNFGQRVPAGDHNGWQLGRRITVRGHFKMQPHGRKRALRKLIFVAGHHRGPLDGAPIHAMKRLEVGTADNFLRKTLQRAVISSGVAA